MGYFRQLVSFLLNSCLHLWPPNVLKNNLIENSVSLFLSSIHFKILFFLAEVKNKEPGCGSLANSVLRYTCLFPRAAVTNGYQPSILKQQRFILTLLESKSSQSGCREDMLSLKTLRKNLFLPLPSFWMQRRRWHPTPVLLPGKSQGRRSLVGCSPWGLEESDTTERLHFHALEKEMATHSSVLAWRIPGMGVPGGLPSMGLHRVGHDWSNLAAAAAADWGVQMLTRLEDSLVPPFTS